jgi:hypothetical protein
MDLQGILADVYDPVEHALRITSGADVIFVGMGEMQAVAGTATLIAGNGVPRWSFPDAATTTLGMSFATPRSWNTFQVAFVWTAEGGAGGNVRWQVDIKKLDIFIDNISEAVFATGVGNDAAPTIGVLSLVSGRPTGVNATAGALGTMYGIQVSRIGADAGDTLAAAAGLFQVLILRQT